MRSDTAKEEEIYRIEARLKNRLGPQTSGKASSAHDGPKDAPAESQNFA